MTYPSTDPDDYGEWTPPSHECVFLPDKMVEAGILEDGVLRVYEITICNQCPNTQSIRTDRVANQPKR